VTASAFEFGRDRIALINFVIVRYLNVPSVMLVASIVFHALSKSKLIMFVFYSDAKSKFKRKKKSV